jgi:hypothetical protein
MFDGLRSTVGNYTAIKGCQYIVKPELVICKPEFYRGNSAMVKALAV